jgi:hypothetical protein
MGVTWFLAEGICSGGKETKLSELVGKYLLFVFFLVKISYGKEEIILICV